MVSETKKISVQDLVKRMDHVVPGLGKDLIQYQSAVEDMLLCESELYDFIYNLGEDADETIKRIQAATKPTLSLIKDKLGKSIREDQAIEAMQLSYNAIADRLQIYENKIAVLDELEDAVMEGTLQTKEYQELRSLEPQEFYDELSMYDNYNKKEIDAFKKLGKKVTLTNVAVQKAPETEDEVPSVDFEEEPLEEIVENELILGAKGEFRIFRGEEIKAHIKKADVSDKIYIEYKTEGEE